MQIFFVAINTYLVTYFIWKTFDLFLRVMGKKGSYDARFRKKFNNEDIYETSEKTSPN